MAVRDATGSKAMSTSSKLYIVPTDRWYIERTVWLIAGVVLLAATALAALVHPLWVLFGVFAGGALFGFVGVLIAVPACALIGVVARFAIAQYQAFIGDPATGALTDYERTFLTSSYDRAVVGGVALLLGLTAGGVVRRRRPG